MTGTILFVDDEVNTLYALERLCLESGLSCRRAGGGREALAILRGEPVAVLVSDHRMPEMSGVDLLARSEAISPQTVRVLMTAYADLPTAVEAINRGGIFRFVVKPWQNRELLQVLHEALARHDLIRDLCSRNEGTLLSLAQMIELKDPYTRGHCERVGSYAETIAGRLGMGRPLTDEIRSGAWLHDCGKNGVPEAILGFPGPLTEEQFAIIRKHCEWGAEVARQARLSATAVDIILHHHEHFDGRGYPFGLRGEAIPLVARIVTVADVWDALVSDRPYRPALEWGAARDTLAGLRGSVLDPQLTDLFLSWLPPRQPPADQVMP